MTQLSKTEMIAELTPHIGHLDAGALEWFAAELLWAGKENVQLAAGMFWTDEFLDAGVCDFFVNVDANGDGACMPDEGFFARAVVEIVGANWETFTALVL